MWRTILSNSNNRWIARYTKFIDWAMTIPDTGGYTEGHHILPKSLFPDYENDSWNIVRLSPRMHLIAHYILAKAYGGSQWFSVNVMLNAENPYQQRQQFVKLNSKLFDVLRREVVKVQANTTRESRANEDNYAKNLRISKWRETVSKKTPEERALSVRKQKETKQRKIDEGYVRYKPVEKSLCTICNKNICIYRMVRHAEVCKEKIKNPRASCMLCGTKNITKKHKCEEPKPQRFGHFVCGICNAEYKSLSFFEKHIKICVPKEVKEEEIKIKKELEQKLKIIHKCEECGLTFRSEEFLERHNNDIRKHMTKDEKRELGIARRIESFRNMTDEAKAERSRKLSESISKARNSWSDEEKAKNSEITRQAVLKYYSSDDYDSNERSIRVKDGLCKNKEN